MCKCRATCFGHGMRREKLEQLKTTGMLDRKKNSRRKQCKKDGWTNKVAKDRTSEWSSESDEE